MLYPVQDMIQILLMLKVFLIKDSKIQDLLYGAVFMNPAFSFIYHYLFSFLDPVVQN